MSDETENPIPKYFIKITVKEYQELLESAKLLEALESAGVDNWEGYSEALRIMHEGEEVFKRL